jgi:hypothetical protein
MNSTAQNGGMVRESIYSSSVKIGEDPLPSPYILNYFHIMGIYVSNLTIESKCRNRDLWFFGKI